MKAGRSLLVLTTGLLLVMLLGFAALAAGDEVTVVTEADATTLNPLTANESYSSYIIKLVYDGLFVIDKNIQPQPDLVEEWEAVDDTTYVFKLKEGVTFHDGEPLTAEDVKFTYDFIRKPENGHKWVSLFKPINEINVLDDYTVEFKLAEPFSPLIQYLNIGIVPKHIAEKDLESLNFEPVGSGPFAFVKWEPDQRIVLKKNENYWREGLPRLSRVEFRPVPEALTRMVEIETGSADIADVIPPEEVERLQGVEGIEIQTVQPTGYYFLNFNQQVEPLNDIRVRRALSYAVDREELVDFVWYGLNDVANSPVVRDSWAYEDDVTKYDYDPEKARQLLEEAGYGNGFSLTIKISQDPLVKNYAEIIQQQWAQIGVNLDINAQEWGSFFQDVLNGDFEIASTAWIGQDDPDRGLYRQFHQGQIPPTGHNWGFFVNERVSELLDKARTTTDIELRKEYYSEIQKIITAEAQYVYLGEYVIFVAYQDDLVNFSYSPYEYYRNLMYADFE